MKVRNYRGLKSRFLFVYMIFNILAFQGYSQNDTLHLSARQTNLQANNFLKKQILPLSLITAGSLLNAGTIKNKIQDIIPNTHNHIDDILQYGPVGQLYLFDALGFKHQNSVFTQTKYMVISRLTSGLVVYVLKTTTRVKRPEGNYTSFPSGHTAKAFINAAVLYHEFKDTDPWLAYGGYAAATATGILRMTNDAHWLPDVLTGAGLGIFTVDMVYLIQPFKKLEFSNKKKRVSVIPGLGYKSFYLACNF